MYISGSAAWTSAAAFVISCAATEWVLRRAGRLGLIAVPGERSSHVQPTPAGGGLGIVLGVSAGALLSSLLPLPLLAAALLLALIGLCDDIRPLPARLRLAVQAAVCAVPLYGFAPDLPWVGVAVLWVAALWWVNLFNFMDGIDGLAGMQAVFMSAAAGLLLAGQADSGAIVGLLQSVAAAAAGFLLYNRPPARIFMGDVGSTFLGFILLAVAALSVRSGALPWQTWPLLGALFITDATITLLRRVLRGERWYQAHRSHAYQRLARRAGSHLPVTLGAAALNLLWVLPWTAAFVLHAVSPEFAALAVYGPLIVMALKSGAGTPDA